MKKISTKTDMKSMHGGGHRKARKVAGSRIAPRSNKITEELFGNYNFRNTDGHRGMILPSF